MCHELFRVALNTPQSQVEQGVEDGREFNANEYPPVSPARIEPQTYRSVCLTLLAGVLTCGKYLPLRLMNSMVVELTLARPDDALAPMPVQPPLVHNNMSREFELNQCELMFSTVRLDSALEAGFSSMMLSGRALQLNLRTVVSQQSIIPAGAVEHQASVSRALSRIAAIFVTFQGRGAPNNSILRFHNPSAQLAGGERTLEWAVMVGSKQWPESQTCKSAAATMSLLKQALGTYDQSVVCTSITPQNYIANRYVVGVPTSTIPGQTFSGTSTRSGDLLSVLIKGLNGGVGGRRGTESSRFEFGGNDSRTFRIGHCAARVESSRAQCPAHCKRRRTSTHVRGTVGRRVGCGSDDRLDQRKPRGLHSRQRACNCPSRRAARRIADEAPENHR